MDKIRDFINNNRRFHRLLEILPGFVSWNLILFPFWGSFVFPIFVAYLVLVFDVLWFYKSAAAGVASIVSYLKIEAAKKYDWVGDAQKLPGYDQVHHVHMIVNVNEPLHILERSMEAIAHSDFPKAKLIVVLAMEEREKEAPQKAETLIRKFSGKIGRIYFTLHPLLPGEVRGKSSNESYAARWIKKKLIDEEGLDIDFVTITTSDADSVMHPKYYSYLTWSFLSSPEPYRRIWQGAVCFYNNIWRVPLVSRVLNSINTIWQMAQLSRKDRIINYSTYSLSLRMVDEVGYWDTDVIPEDYRMFFKCFFEFGGKVEVEPIFLPINADAAESTTFWKTLTNQYLQQQRWAWGVSDDPLFIKWWLTSTHLPFWNRTIRVAKVLMDHFFWPVNWFIVTLGANLPIIFNPRFSQTVLGQMLPKISSFILTLCLFFLLIIIIVDSKSRPERPEGVRSYKIFLEYLGWPLLPVIGFFLGALPGIDAHTRLMLGKYLEYRVTEKV